MIKHPLLVLCAGVLAIGESSGSQQYHEAPIVLRSDPVKADCQTGHLEKYPRYLASGLELSLVFRGPIEASGHGELFDQLPTEFRLANVIVNDARVLFVTAQKQVASREAVDQLIRKACEIERIPGFRLTGAQTIDEREKRRADIQRAAQRVERARWERETARRRAAEERAALRALRRSPPTPDELTVLLRDKWDEVLSMVPDNPVTEGKFSRVRDVRCSRREGRFHCLVGVLGTSKQGPEYEQLELEFRRLENGTVELEFPEVVIT
ncbi:hypothetical protein [Sphingomonas sp.]|uniref:hypothetical protein n=1 Tax=Sphingomonas sp. TaxID=28214 RepID=UPI002ED838DC